MSLELYRIRQARFFSLVDKGEWETLTSEFSRSILAWEKRLEVSNYDLSVVEQAIGSCRKCPEFWILLLDRTDDSEMYTDALDAVGLDWDGDKVVDKVRIHVQSRGISETQSDYLSRIVNRTTRVSGDTSPSSKDLFEIESRYEPIVFPKNWSSFSLPKEAVEYVDALPQLEEQESLLQRLVLYYNDDLESWRMYCDWLERQNRKEHLMVVLETACSQYVSYNSNIWAMCAKYALDLGEEDRAREWFREALRRSPEYLECEWLEKIAMALPEDEWSDIFPEDSIHGLFVRYLRWTKSGDKENLRSMVQILKSRHNVDFPEADLCLFCYALEESGIKRDIRLDRILKQNAHKILRMLSEENPLREQVIKLVEGSTSAPLPVCKAPPKPVVHVNSHNLPKRPLPGYTPGWMVEEFAKKHKI